MTTEITSKFPFVGALESRIGGRAENQDSAGFSDTPLGLLILVCDGMGGGPDGKTASLTATRIIIDYIKSCPQTADREKSLQDAISAAQAGILSITAGDPNLKGMGTTVVAILINEDSAVIANVGDSRCYKLRNGAKIFRSKDHSLIAQKIRNKELTEEQGRLSAQANIITRAIGAQNCTPEVYEVPFEKGDLFVLCSDGIWGAMSEPLLLKRFKGPNSPQTIVGRLSTEVDELGKLSGNHHDNLTLAIIKTSINSNLKEKMNKQSKLIIAGLLVLLVLSIYGNISQLINKSLFENKQAEIEKLQQETHKKDSLNDVLNDSISELNTQQKMNSTNLELQRSTAELEREKEVGRLKDTINELRLKLQKFKESKSEKNTNLSITKLEQKKNINVEKEIKIRKVNGNMSIQKAKNSIVELLNQLLKFTEQPNMGSPNKTKIYNAVLENLNVLKLNQCKKNPIKVQNVISSLTKNKTICLYVEKDGTSTTVAKAKINEMIEAINNIPIK